MAGVISLLATVFALFLFAISCIFRWQIWLLLIPDFYIRLVVVFGASFLFAGLVFLLVLLPGWIARNKERAPGYYYRPSIWRRFFLLLLRAKSLLRIK
jgi:hypothetical protein